MYNQRLSHRIQVCGGICLLALLLAAIVPMTATHVAASGIHGTTLAPLAPSANWQIETVAASGVRPDIAVDLDRHAHLVYLDEGDLKYATDASGAWATTTLDASGQVRDAALALDAGSNVHVTYAHYAGATCTLKYRHNRGDAWSAPEPVTTSSNGCWAISPAVDNAGNVHISFIGAPGIAFSGSLSYTTNVLGGWSPPSSPTSIKAYDDAALAVDATGRAHISFYSISFGGLFYVTNRPGGWQTAVEIDPTGGQAEGQQTDIVLDLAGMPHIIYVGGPSAQPSHAFLKPNTAWEILPLDTGSGVSYGNAIASDHQDQQHLAYYHVSSNELRYQSTYGDIGPGHGAKVDDNGKHPSMAVDLFGMPHIAYEDAGAIKVATLAATDTDGDGIPDRTEQGPQGMTPGYDGDGDGQADAQQENAASFFTVSGHYVTLSCPEGQQLLAVQSATARAVSTPAPAGVEFPFGLLSFVIDGLEIGGATTATLTFGNAVTVDSYYRFGPTPDDATPHWYDYAYAAQSNTGVTFAGNTVQFHFVDGARGDDDGQADGVIHDVGGPVTGSAPAGLNYLPVILSR